MLLFVTFHSDLVTPDDGLQAVLLAEALGDIWSELHTHTTLAWAAAWLGLRVCPQHLHHETSLTWLLLPVPVQLADVVQSNVVIGEQTAMEDKVLLAD